MMRWNSFSTCFIGAVLFSTAFIKISGQTVSSIQNTKIEPQPVGTRYVYETVAGRELSLWVEGQSTDPAIPRLPALVLFHGGGWVVGSANQFNQQALTMAKLGVVVIQPEYRLVKPKDSIRAPIADATAAWRWVHDHAEQLGIDPERIGVGGGSAGGQLAAYLGMIAKVSEPALMVLYNPVVDLGPGACCQTHAFGDYRTISPLYHVRPNLPATLIFHGAQDVLVSPVSIRAFVQAMKKAGNQCSAIFYPGVGHAFFNQPEYENKTTTELIDFLTARGWIHDQPR